MVVWLLLRAPLSREAGGLALCQPGAFADTADPAYQDILARIVAASRTHQHEKRFDLAGFRPNAYYIRAMQRYGILPPGLGPEDPVDVYAADRAYWQSFWYCSHEGAKR